MNIRRACIDDAKTIIDFQQKLATETEGISLDPALIVPGVNAVFSDNTKGRYYVAEKNGKIIASLLITLEWSDWRNSYIWWFQSVYVLPQHRREGVFRQMYNYIKLMALEHSAGGLRLYVESENTRAQKTYEAMGMNGDHYKLYEWLK